MAGLKGSGLALLVQVLAGSLVGADSFDNNSSNAGNFVMAIDPNLFTTIDEFKTRVTDISTKIKSARKIAGVAKVLIPGERGNQIAKSRLDSGEIEVEDNLLSELKKVTS